MHQLLKFLLPIKSQLIIVQWIGFLLVLTQCTNSGESSRNEESFERSSVTSDTLSFVLEGKAYLTVECRNVKGLTEFAGKYLSFLPMNSHYTDTVQVEKDTTITLTLAIQRPEIVDFYLFDYPNSPYKLLLLPSDTLKLTLDLAMADWEQPKADWKGTTAKACQYYDDKFHFFKMNPFPIKTSLTASKLSLPEVATQVDSITRLEVDFLDQYARKHKLPGWFTALEKNDLVYFAAGVKIGAEGYRKDLQHRYEKLDSHYYDFVYQLPTYQEEALFSTYYYVYLHSLNYWLTERKYGIANMDTMGGEGRTKLFIPYSLTLADSLLKGEIKDLFKVKTLFGSPVRHQMFTWATQLLGQSGPYQYEQYPAFLTRYINAALLTKHEPAPNFTLRNLQDQVVSLQDFKGKVVLLNFWATWCKPCLKRVPEETKLVRSLAGKPFIMINVCLESPKEQWKKTVQQFKMPGIHLYAGGQQLRKLSQDYNINGYPHYVLVDQTGRVHQNNPFYSSNSLTQEISTLVKSQ